MPTYTTDDIRNIALLGHASAGKTSIAEAILFKAGRIGHMGHVEAGDTVSDFTEEEKHHKHSLHSTPLSFDYQGKHINLIDTPGYPDFVGHALLSIPAVETAAIVVNAAAGIESMTRLMMGRSARRKLCRFIVINRIDAENVDLEDLVDQIQTMFGASCLPLNLPADNGRKVVDCFFNPAGESDFGSVADAHAAIIDQVVEVDEDLMAVYLEKGEVSPAQLHEAFEKALREGHLVPILFTAASRHDDHNATTGIDELLEVIVKLAPSPKEGNPRPFLQGDDDATAEELHGVPDASLPALAHVFRVVTDPFVGKLATFRVHQGTVSHSSHLFCGRNKKPLRLNHIMKLNGKDHEEIDAAIPGDIVAVAKIDELHRDSVIRDASLDDHVHLRPIVFPTPMQGLAVTTAKRGDEQKLGDALHKLEEEDPTFNVTRDATTHETVMHAMGDLHMRIILERLKEHFKVEVETKPPKIAYRETITAAAEGHHRHKKQSGGAGQFGEVFIRIEPLERGAGFEFCNETVGGSIPQQFVPAVEKGVRQVLEEGAIAGYPLQDVKVSLYDGKHHAVDSKEVAFVAAGRRAFIDGVSKARPVLLEPCVAIEVTVPASYLGDVTSDLSGKRGRIQGTDMIGDDAAVRAVVPLAEVSSYQNQLKSVTGGQGSFTMEFSHYEPVPGHIQDKVIAEYKPRVEED